MVLTKGDKMILTPTYHVFKMYAVHQNAKYIPLSFHSPKYTFNGESIDAISATLSKKDGVYHLSVTNVDSKKENTVTLDLSALNATTTGKAEIITSKSFADYNSFDNPNVIKAVPFNGATVKKGELTVKLPPMSVVTIELL